MNKKTKIEDEKIGNINISIRVRPLSVQEQAKGNHDIVLINENNGLIALNCDDNSLTPFQFDYVFGQNSTQMHIFQTIITPVIEDCLDGDNGAILVYGQSRTGKTFTMTGGIDGDCKGIIPNTFHYLFDRIKRLNKDRKFRIAVSYLEIHNDEIRDLLATSNKTLTIRECKCMGVYVTNLTPVIVNSIELINDLFIKGNQNRSTKSHTIFTIWIESNLNKNRIFTKLNLVDLAGCECFQDTGNIDPLLSVIENVTLSLSNENHTNMPYQRSKLTRLLQDSFDDKSKTRIIATISPSNLDYDHSIRTLQYVNRVKNIKKFIGSDNQQEVSELESRTPSYPLRKSDKNKKIQQEEEEPLQWEKEIEIEKNKLKERISVMRMDLFEKEKQMFDQSHKKLTIKLQRKNQKRLKIQQNYSNLQEINRKITQGIEEIEKNLDEIRRKLVYKYHEYQRDIDSLKNRNRFLLRKIQLATMIINNYVPDKYLKIIEDNLDSNNQDLINAELVGNKLEINQHKQPIQSINADIETVYRTYSKTMKNGNLRDETF